MDPLSFNDQVAVVTGGGRGLGRAYCLELARRGASVVVNDVSAEHADQVVAEIEAGGGRAVASHDSVATPEGGAAIVRRAVVAFGTVDALVSNAGILRNNYFQDMTVEQIDEVLDVNLRGALFVTQPAWRIMLARGYGRVVLTSSAAGLFSRPGSVNYSAAKAAMYGMCRALSFEGRDHGIKINLILPRASTTISADNPVPGIAETFPPAVKEALATRRDPRLTAPLVCYLASRACAVSGEAFSSAFGNYSRVFVGRSRGWLAPDPAATTAEDIAANLGAIEDRNDYSVPLSNFDEVAAVAERLGIDARTGQAVSGRG
jgi:NAD(P)-dependent dehydrogenase (short-subunit alcohol dehydrogenase family)